ncbi:unnamed protein product [marine sediment metagenome]|uniref:GTP-binding protein n=1 Tax=marine sediment metagenome TaxID=412755 RepID=X1BD67_9ZZZZ
MVLKILLLGGHGSGKTSFIIRYISGYFLKEEDLPHSRAVDFFQKNIEIDGESVELDLWDFGPEEGFRFLLQQYSKKTSGAIYVCDITNPLSLKHIPDWVHIVRDYRGRVPILLIGNKLDLKDNRAFKYSAGRKAVERYDLFDYVELSTKTGENFENAIFETFGKK